MWPESEIQQRLGIKHPIILAPMAGASSPELVAAVSNAGGLGSYGAAATSPQALRDIIRAIKKLTDKPFAINLFAPSVESMASVSTEALQTASTLIQQWHQQIGVGDVPEIVPVIGPFYEQLAVIIEEKVPVFSFHFGPAPLDAIEELHGHGIPVLASATTVLEAEQLEAAGVDVIVAQGSEAGGHRATFAKPFSQGMNSLSTLLPDIVNSVSTPVIAAGGIMNGQHIDEVIDLGASGVQMGTAFLACPENTIAEAYRQAVLTAKADNTQITEAFSGRPARAIKNYYVNEMLAHQETILPFPVQMSLVRKLRKYAADTNNPDFISMWAGQSVALSRDISASELFETLLVEFQQSQKTRAS